jgi:hypothetical protein
MNQDDDRAREATPETSPTAAGGLTEEASARGQDGDWLSRVLPIIRSRRVTRSFLLLPVIKGRDIVALYGHSLVIAKNRRDDPVPEECYLADGPESLLAGGIIRTDQVIPLDDVTRARAIPASRIDKNSYYRVDTARGRFKFVVPADGSPNLNRALSELLGPRAEILRSIPFRLRPSLFLLWLIIQGSSLFLASDRVGEHEPWLAAALSLGPLLLFGPIFALDNLPVRGPNNANVRKRAPRSRPAQPPIFKRRLGLFLRVAGGLGLVTTFLLHDQIISRFFPKFLFEVNDPRLIDFLVNSSLYLPVAAIYIGYALSRRGAVEELEQDTRSPILYLRAFQDDGRNNLNPTSALAAVAGLRSPDFIASLPRPWRFLFDLHPVRIVRIIFGTCVDSAEEQLGLYLRKRGPFVAVGEPGEHLATPGAARLYVADADWQKTVLDLMDRSQLVILQPAKTEGIWWEIEQTLTRVGPERTLVCMVNFKNRQNDYEDFRLRAEATSRHSLPRSVGNSDAPTFLYFEADRSPHLVELSYLSPLLWVFLHRAADFDHTLGPILDRVKGGPAPAPSLPRIHRGMRLLGLVECVFLFYVWSALAIFCRQKVDRALAPSLQIATGVPVRPLSPAGSAREESAPIAVVYAGRSNDYRIALEAGWRHLPPQQGQDLRFEAGDGVSLTITMGPPEDLGRFPEKFADAVRAKLGSPVALDSRAELVLVGRKWLDFLIRFEREGKSTSEHVRVSSDEGGAIMLLGGFPSSDPLAAKKVRRAFDSLALSGPANSLSGLPATFTGIALDYQITLDGEWSRVKPPAKCDIAFTTRGSAELEVVAGPARESLDAFPAQFLASIEKNFPGRVKVVRNEMAIYNNRIWREIDLKIAIDGGPIERRVRAYSGDEGTLIALATAKEADEKAILSIQKAFDSLILPKAAGLKPAGR